MVEKPSFCTPKLRFRPTISPFPRFSRYNISLDHMNLGRGNDTESACHGDLKLCSTRHENFSLEVVISSARELLPRSLIWVHQHRRYSFPFRIILTPSAKELAITFHLGIRIAYVSAIRNQHSETVNKMLVSQNSVPGLKFHRGACVVVHRLSYPLGKTWIFHRATIGTAFESPIQNRHFDPVGTRPDSMISGPSEKPHGVGLSCRSKVVFNSARELLPRSLI
ncbi:hypothetical protein Taro_007251 [Colocasia esculenta]|uniref:Uncharacterized protein n=1 Tax=Colocasia esculenta TaxID=4460 RepID=A0A843U3A4_COLES|nr:hypothetical protein [Colocasia esculenta]